MRWWWLIALAGCPNKPSTKAKPHDAAIAKAIDAAPDALVMSPQDGEVSVGAFVIDKRETTIAEYRACVDAFACTKTDRGIEIHGKQPAEAMGGVTFLQARTYCAWKGKRLPTPMEWRRAAYGDDARKFPWGDEPPTCERAVFDACKAAGPLAPGGRAAGASPFGVEDMLGNASEWTDPGPIAVTSACVERVRDKVPLLGGGYADRGFDRTAHDAEASTWVDNREHGIRCARGPVTAPPVTTDPVLTAKTWVLTPVASAKAAMIEVARRCKAGEPATWIAGELVGQKGFQIVTATPAPDAITVPRPDNLVRVVGHATCGDVDDTTKLTIKTDAKTYRLQYPSALGGYQLWLPAGTWLTLEGECERQPDRGECSFGMMTSAPARFRVPSQPASGVEGPAFEAHGGMTCD